MLFERKGDDLYCVLCTVKVPRREGAFRRDEHVKSKQHCTELENNPRMHCLLRCKPHTYPTESEVSCDGPPAVNIDEGLKKRVAASVVEAFSAAFSACKCCGARVEDRFLKDSRQKENEQRILWFVMKNALSV
jgi:hypothetical protein